MKRSSMRPGSFAIPSKRKYPINTLARARNAVARVQQHGTPAEKRKVFAAVKKKYPSLARRSNVIPTRSGPGRRIGKRPRTKAGGSSTPGTVRRRRGGGRMATRKQIAAAKRNIKKAQAKRRGGGAGGATRTRRRRAAGAAAPRARASGRKVKR